MRIAFDIDDTLTDTMGPTIKSFNKIFTKLFTKEDVQNLLKDKNYNYIDDPLTVIYNISKEEVQDIHNKYGHIVLNECKPFIEALNTIKEYKEQGHEIFYITARSLKWYDLTLNWLQLNDFPEGTLIHEENDKSKIASELGIDIFYEDNISNALNISKRGIKTYLVNSITNYHNLPINIKRITWENHTIVS